MKKDKEKETLLRSQKELRKGKVLVLLDGNALVHRAYHALPPLTTKKGELVNAVYGFTATLLSVLEKFQPNYIVATFDLPAPTFRHKSFAAYKATRKKAPEDLYAQIPRVKDVVRAFHIPLYEKEGFEADDLIGTLAAQATKKNIETVIVTGDNDTLQLVNSHVKVFTMRRGITDTVLYDEKAVCEKYGFSPKQLPDFKGLCGDQSDNIPGVGGIGIKTATDLLRAHKTLAGVYASLEKIKPAVRIKLEKDRAQAQISKELGTIAVDVPITLDISQSVIRETDMEGAVALLTELNFQSLVKRISKKGQQVVTAVSIPGDRGTRYALCAEDDAEKFFSKLADEKEISFAMHCDGEWHRGSILRGIAFATTEGKATYVPYTKKTHEGFAKIFSATSCKKTGYDSKSTLKVLHEVAIPCGNIENDVLLETYVLDPGSKNNLGALVQEEFGTILSEKEDAGQLAMDVDQESDVQRFCQQADFIAKLHARYKKRIAQISAEQRAGHTLADVLKKIEIPLVPVLAKMEEYGVQLNPIVFRGISETIEKKIVHMEKQIYKLAGKTFNINSPQQLSQILFSLLGISTQSIKKTKTGYSTAASELEKIRKDHAIIEKVEEYRELFKLKTTYLDVLPTLLDKNKRIHTTFNQAVTATGRLSSSDPNLQNIPIRSDLGKLLRMAFVAQSGFQFVSADYSQIDLRCVAHMSGDKKMIAAFKKGEDIHKITAAEVHKVSLSQVSEKMRRSAKTLNFGMIYGMSVFGFSQAAGIDREDAKKFVDEYFKRFQGVANYMRKTKARAKKHGYVETLFGRRRTIATINSPTFQVQQAAERMAINMPIQGLTADIMKLAMLAVDKHIQVAYAEQDVHMILQVHDEIILEVREGLAEKIGEEIKDLMEKICVLDVPLVVVIKKGESWGEL